MNHLGDLALNMAAAEEGKELQQFYFWFVKWLRAQAGHLNWSNPLVWSVILWWTQQEVKNFNNFIFNSLNGPGHKPGRLTDVQWLGKSLAPHKIILYLLQVSRNSYHIYMIIYIYSRYIFDMNMRSGSHALLHVEKGETNGVLTVLQILHLRVYRNMKN